MVNTGYFIAVEITDRVACHCIALALIACDDGVSILYQTFHFVADGSQVCTDRVSPVTDLISPGSHQFDTFVLNLSKIADARYGGEQVLGILLIVYSFEMETVTEHIGFKTGFPCFYFLPTETWVGQISQLVARIDDSRFAEYGSKSIFQQRFCRISLIHILVSQCTPRTFQFQHVQPRDIFHKFFFGHQPSGTYGVEILPLVAGICES